MVDLIVLGTYQDRHVASVTDRLRKKGIEILIIDYLNDCSISYSILDGNIIYFRINDTDVRDLHVVWNRQKIHYASPFYFKFDYSSEEKLQSQERTFGFRENQWKAFYRFIMLLFPDRTFNDPVGSAFMPKVYQQIIAQELGLQTPATLVTTSKKEVLEFIHNNRRNGVVTKSFSGGAVRTEKGMMPFAHGLMTSEVREDDVREAGEESFKACPQMFQRKIDKNYELRVVMLVDRCFAFRIESQTWKFTQTDWRYGNSELHFTKVDIAEKLQRKLRNFLERFNLLYGSFDLIVDQDDEIWFLECNQDGAWAWLDIQEGGIISDAFADVFLMLVERSRAGDLKTLTSRSPSLDRTGVVHMEHEGEDR